MKLDDIEEKFERASRSGYLFWVGIEGDVRWLIEEVKRLKNVCSDCDGTGAPKEGAYGIVSSTGEWKCARCWGAGR